MRRRAACGSGSRATCRTAPRAPPRSRPAQAPRQSTASPRRPWPRRRRRAPPARDRSRRGRQARGPRRGGARLGRRTVRPGAGPHRCDWNPASSRVSRIDGCAAALLRRALLQLLLHFHGPGDGRAAAVAGLADQAQVAGGGLRLPRLAHRRPARSPAPRRRRPRRRPARPAPAAWRGPSSPACRSPRAARPRSAPPEPALRGADRAARAPPSASPRSRRDRRRASRPRSPCRYASIARSSSPRAAKVSPALTAASQRSLYTRPRIPYVSLLGPLRSISFSSTPLRLARRGPARFSASASCSCTITVCGPARACAATRPIISPHPFTAR